MPSSTSNHRGPLLGALLRLASQAMTDDPDDARASRVRLTTRGRAYGRAVRAFARGIEAEWAEQIGAQRVEELRATLQLLRTKVFLADE
jgi:DNA-binding MarR family transcriptional regulator